MPDLTTVAFGIISALVGIVAMLVRRKNGHGRMWDGRERRVAPNSLQEWRDGVKEDLREVRDDVRAIRQEIPVLGTRVALLERDVVDLRGRDREGR